MGSFIDVVLHLDVHLNEWVALFGIWIYPLLFAVIFCETGLVVTPFLPGDSLLFALGAMTTVSGAVLSYPVLMMLLMVAAILGNSANYAIGRFFGPKLFQSQDSRFLNRKHLDRTHQFYETYGGKTIILSRFLPIFRTFAPFVAGIGKMQFLRFSVFNAVGGIVWVGLFLTAGNFLGNVPAIKQNFHLVIFAIIIISALPAVIELVRSRQQISALTK